MITWSQFREGYLLTPEGHRANYVNGVILLFIVWAFLGFPRVEYDPYGPGVVWRWRFGFPWP